MPAQPVADRVKTTRGTLRGRKPAAAGDRLTEPPRPPARLSAAAKREWRALADVLVEVGTLTQADLRALALLSELLADVSALEAEVRRDGYTIPAASGGRKGNPSAAALAQARAQATRMLDSFGLTPKARGGVDPAPDAGDDEDPAGRYFR